jgi:DNA replication protein DnaC
MSEELTSDFERKPLEDPNVPEAGGVDTTEYDPNCKHCTRGYVSTGPYIMNKRICVCVIARQEQRGVAKRIEANFPKRARNMTLATFRPGPHRQNELALKAARNFVKHWETAREEGWTLGFYGDPSAGKTHLATGIALALMKKHQIDARVMNVSAMLKDTRDNFDKSNSNRSPIDIAIEADFLVLDDLGAERQKAGDEYSWVAEVLYQITDARVMDCRPTVFTTNIPPNELRAVLGSGSSSEIVGTRIWERIERAQLIPPLQVLRVAGEARQSTNSAKKILG